MINVNELTNKQLAREYINENEYVRNNNGSMTQHDYDYKMNYIRNLRTELYENRKVKSYSEIYELAQLK